MNNQHLFPVLIANYNNGCYLQEVIDREIVHSQYKNLWVYDKG